MGLPRELSLIQFSNLKRVANIDLIHYVNQLAVLASKEFDDINRIGFPAHLRQVPIKKSISVQKVNDNTKCQKLERNYGCGVRFCYLKNRFIAANRLCRLCNRNMNAVTGMPGNRLLVVFIVKNTTIAVESFIIFGR